MEMAVCSQLKGTGHGPTWNSRKFSIIMRDSNLRPHLMYQDSETGDGGYYPATSERNSSRVDLRSRKAPSMALVTVPDCCFSTPRIIMQKGRASQITPTPFGSSTSCSVCATCCV